MPVNLTPLSTRIYEVLLSGSGNARTISATYDAETSTEGQFDSEVGFDTLKGAQIKVIIGSLTPIQHNTISNLGLFDVGVSVEISYSLPPELNRQARITFEQVLWDNAIELVEALRFPNNLTETVAGVSTGLASGMLNLKAIPMPKYNWKKGICTVTAQLTGKIQLER